MKVSPTQLFNESLSRLGESKAKIILQNFAVAEEIIKCALDQSNLKKITMVLKVKNSKYYVQYEYDKPKNTLIAKKIRL